MFEEVFMVFIRMLSTIEKTRQKIIIICKRNNKIIEGMKMNRRCYLEEELKVKKNKKFRI